MKLTDLKPADYNAAIRQISPHARAGLSASLAEFGDISGITFNRRTGRLVTGHQRVARLKEQYGDLDITGERIVTPAGHVFPVRFVDWDEDKERLANVCANNPALSGFFTDQTRAFIDSLPAAPALRLDELAEGLTIPDDIPPFTPGQSDDDTPPFTPDPSDADFPEIHPRPRQQLPPDFEDDEKPPEVEKEDKSLKYPVYFSLNKSNFERWKRLRKNLQLKDNELAVRLLDDQEAYEGE